jgi:hypothetical protein
MSDPKSRVETARLNAQALRRRGLQRLERAIVLLEEMQAEYEDAGGLGDRDFPRLARLLRECRYHFSGALKDQIDDIVETVAGRGAEELPSATAEQVIDQLLSRASAANAPPTDDAP